MLGRPTLLRPLLHKPILYCRVKSNDVIPRDLGKKGRWKDLVIRVQSSTNEFEDRLASEMIANTGDGSVDGVGGGDGGESTSLGYCVVDETTSTAAKRRYKRRLSNREVSPLTTKQAQYEPSCMEQRARWWLSDRRRADTGALREMMHSDSFMHAAAAFRIMGNAMYTASGTKADEPGAVNGLFI